jgi:hypothetical protein
MHCGGRVDVAKALKTYDSELRTLPTGAGSDQEQDNPPPVMEGVLDDAQSALQSHKFELAITLFNEILATGPDDVQARWGLINAKTHNLKAITLKDPDDFAHSEANALFSSDLPGVEQAWRDSYWSAFETCCRMTVEAIDPRVFLELEIYRWYPSSNTFLYPISKDFDIQPILDKELWSVWKKLQETLPPSLRIAFKELCDNCCRRIREYFHSGFAHTAEIQSGDWSRLQGTWHMKQTTGAQKNEVLNFFQNAAGIPHMEAYRTGTNSYEYYRNIRLDKGNRIHASEHRHFPSTSGLGGDFYFAGDDTPALALMAVYEYILILPTALYTRMDSHKIPNNGRALAFIEKCKTMPCFLRGENLKQNQQMRPISDNHDTSDPSKKMRSCYIATAVYGDIEAPEVCRLRRFRDEKLNTTRLGRRLCVFYYKVSPKLALRLSPSGPFSRFVRRVLDIFVRRLNKRQP